MSEYSGSDDGPEGPFQPGEPEDSSPSQDSLATPPTKVGTQPASEREPVEVIVRSDTPEVENFEFIRVLGKGGMGYVWLARDEKLKREVAIKFMRDPSGEQSIRFRREAQAAAKIDHPNVVRVHHFGECERGPYIVEEYVPGEHLGKHLEQAWEWRKVLKLGTELAQGLAAAHEQGVLHRDIKPANILIKESGEPKLLDFGLAKLLRVNASGVDSISATMRRETDPDLRSSNSANGKATVNTPADRAATADVYTAGTTEPESGAVMGTPYYIAPEIYRGESFSTASDVYSLGTVLYELCAGVAPFRSVVQSTLSTAVMAREPTPLAEVAPTVNRAFAGVIDRCLMRDPNQRPGSGKELARVLCELSEPSKKHTEDVSTPYPGLRSFGTEDAEAFFGRDNDIEDVLKLLCTHPLVAVIGPSGIGKSSLVHAGVVPRLLRHGLYGSNDIAPSYVPDHAGALASEPTSGQIGIKSDPWSVCTIVPGTDPMQALSTALSQYAKRAASEVECLLSSSPDELGQYVVDNLTSAGLVIVVDQLEELVMHKRSTDEASRFGQALAALATRTEGIRVVATLRGSELGELVYIPGLGELVIRGLHRLFPLTRTKLREVIEQPARHRKVQFESSAMVERLLDSASDAVGSLPLLQFALRRLWDLRNRERGVIPESALDEIGGVSGALAQYADSVLDQFVQKDGYQAARRILMALARRSENGTRQSRLELTKGEAVREQSLDRLVERRLIVLRRDEGQSGYEIAHEALMKEWPRLLGWRREEDFMLDIKQQLSKAAAIWNEHDRTDAALWRGKRLRDADELDASDLSELEAAFLRASQRAAQRARRRRWWASILTTVAVAGLIGTGYAVYRYQVGLDIDRLLQQAQVPMKEAESLARDYWHKRDRVQVLLASLGSGPANEQARIVKSDEGVASTEQDPLEEAELLWEQALQLTPALQEQLQAAMVPLEQALLRDPKRDDVRALLAKNLEAQARLAAGLGHEPAFQALLKRIALYDPGRAAAWEEPIAVEVTVPAAPTDACLEVYEYQGQIDGAMARVLRERVCERSVSLLLSPGSYLFEMNLLNYRDPLRYPLWIAPDPERGRRGQPMRIRLDLPPSKAIPEGFVFVPAGRFWAGMGGDAMAERAREWALAPPLHQRDSDAFLIATHETTFGDWVEFLRNLPPAVRDRYRPRVDTGQQFLELAEDAQGFLLRLQLSDDNPRYEARVGEKIAYGPESDQREQDWLKAPVVGISGEDVTVYTAWLNDIGRVPGARLCREDEWLRAARGADRRTFPHGNRLLSHEANFDERYDRFSGRWGPDEVGAHPQSRSPFGLYDMAGNVQEMTTPLFSETAGLVIRSSGFAYTARMNELVNRDFVSRSYRQVVLGVRICADAPVD